MKNIIILVPSLGIGGQEKAAINAYNALKDSHNVYFVIFQHTKNEYNFFDKYYNLNVPANNNICYKICQQIKRIFKLKEFCKTKNIEYILSFGQTVNITNIFLKKIYNIKSYISLRNYDEIFSTKINKFLFKNSDKIICVSKEMENDLKLLFPKLNNTVVVENGFNRKGEIKNDINKTLSINPKIIAMGRLEAQKGFDRLIMAFSCIVNNIPKAHLSIIGEGSLKENLVKLIKQEKLENNVSLLGYKNNPGEELIKHDLFVLSSNYEGFPNCLIEAISYGLVSVAKCV